MAKTPAQALKAKPVKPKLQTGLAAQFLDMAAAERGAARNTLDAYGRDLDDYLTYLAARGSNPLAADTAMVRAWTADLDVRGLAPKLSSIGTQMQTILEQQKQLLDLRSSVEKSDAITSGIKDQLDKYDRDIEDLWKAMDDLSKNPIQ